MTPNANGIAIIGMAGRFPKARDVEEYWKNLCLGVEGISFFSDEELEGIAAPKDKSRYVKARGILEGADAFDAAFFGINPREAEIMDPQHRLFLESAWEALESAGYCLEAYKGKIGVYAGSGAAAYMLNLMANPLAMGTSDATPIFFANGNDFLATRVSYKLNLNGPGVTVQTACSTGLVAIHIACRALLLSTSWIGPARTFSTASNR